MHYNELPAERISLGIYSSEDRSPEALASIRKALAKGFYVNAESTMQYFTGYEIVAGSIMCDYHVLYDHLREWLILFGGISLTLNEMAVYLLTDFIADANFVSGYPCDLDERLVKAVEIFSICVLDEPENVERPAILVKAAWIVVPREAQAA